MTLLGGFSIGAAPAEPSSMEMSLDDMIADRRKKDNAARSVATSRVRRKAAMDARRGFTTNKKPTPMQIEKEVQKEQLKTAAAAKPLSNRALKKLPPKERNQARRKQRQDKKMLSNARKQEAVTSKGKKGKAVVSTLARPPSKKALNAAVSAMQGAGFSIPEGMQMVVSFAPAPAPADNTGSAKKTGGKQKSKQKKKGAQK